MNRLPEDKVPTRKVIAELMAEILVDSNKRTQKDKADRNKLRMEKVKTAVEPEVFEIIQTDLHSYSEWE